MVQVWSWPFLPSQVQMPQPAFPPTCHPSSCSISESFLSTTPIKRPPLLFTIQNLSTSLALWSDVSSKYQNTQAFKWFCFLFHLKVHPSASMNLSWYSIEQEANIDIPFPINFGTGTSYFTSSGSKFGEATYFRVASSSVGSFHSRGSTRTIFSINCLNFKSFSSEKT